MLLDVSAFEPILDDDFSKALRGKVLVNTSSVPVNFSEKLAGFDHIEEDIFRLGM